MAVEKIVELPLSKIKADFSWNGRYVTDPNNPDWAADSGAEDETNDFSSLKGSIAERGQDTPVIVRPVGRADNVALVSGFRRFLAISQIAEEKGDKAPTIKCIVRKLDDLEATLANARENTERQGYRPADIAYMVGRVKSEYEKKGVKCTGAALAADFGVSPSYVSGMLSIVDGLAAKIFEAWRALPRNVNFNSVVGIAKLPKSEQPAAWADLTTEASGESDAAKKAKKVDALCKKAEAAGTLLGRLAYNEMVLEADDFSVKDAIEILVKLPGGKSKLTARQRAKVANAAQLAYTKAKEGQDEPGQETEEESEE